MLRYIYLVDPDDTGRAALQDLLARTAEASVGAFASLEELLRHSYDLSPGIIAFTDGSWCQSAIGVGDALHSALGRRFGSIVLSKSGSIPRAVSALKAGALDYIEAPFDTAGLGDAIEHAFQRMETEDRAWQERQRAQDLIARLSKREREVLGRLVLGHTNKAMAAELGISVRTVEMFRASMMVRIEARTLPDAIRIAFLADLGRQQVE